ncbi:hypothetical protein ACH4PU_18230 [Streptomyces sp. NPDC021100]|uniref:hypothetical protein n=1 Tax=Streptomyces sp. NPDC021100 TaxID=3365114 RepID=UPI003794E91A
MSQTKLTRAKKAFAVLAIAGAATAFGAGSALADDHTTVIGSKAGIVAAPFDDHTTGADRTNDDHTTFTTGTNDDHTTVVTGGNDDHSTGTHHAG